MTGSRILDCKQKKPSSSLLVRNENGLLKSKLGQQYLNEARLKRARGTRSICDEGLCEFVMMLGDNNARQVAIHGEGRVVRHNK